MDIPARQCLNRRLSDVRLWNHLSLPQLKLNGKWLEDLGFNTGQSVIVTVERGKLVIETELRF
ncbi:SymE family type I addiction module toxin [Pectobacterium peruviense]|uniref:SymE family type I addiction module toxin n=1 Tax=Pectobacterium peruviense TaxID=2066479 RepID=UPI0034A22C93